MKDRKLDMRRIGVYTSSHAANKAEQQRASPDASSTGATGSHREAQAAKKSKGLAGWVIGGSSNQSASCRSASFCQGEAMNYEKHESAPAYMAGYSSAYDYSMSKAEREAQREQDEVHTPIESVVSAIRGMSGMTDEQLKQIIFVLGCKAANSGCNRMAVAGLDDAAEVL